MIYYPFLLKAILGKKFNLTDLLLLREECKLIIVREADINLHMLLQGTLSNYCTNVLLHIEIYFFSSVPLYPP